MKEGIIRDDMNTLGSWAWEPKMKPRVVKLLKPFNRRAYSID